MTSPIGAKEGYEMDIGELVCNIAKRHPKQPPTKDDRDELERKCVRQDNNTDFQIVVHNNEPPAVKTVVIPDFATLDGSKIPNEKEGSYGLRDEYFNQTFAKNHQVVLDAADNWSDPDEKAIIQKFLATIQAPRKLTAEEFWKFRLGEYCVSQCY